MKFSIDRCPDGVVEFSGSFNVCELEDLQLDQLDHALLDKASCEDATTADFLLALEAVYRRHQDQLADPASLTRTGEREVLA